MTMVSLLFPFVLDMYNCSDISGAELFFLLFFLGSAGFKEQRKDFAFEIG
jgi:hypothetical protein